ncbi:hypothetical protein Bpfe_016270, partial [Biomphalaria pfeifferi]
MHRVRFPGYNTEAKIWRFASVWAPLSGLRGLGRSMSSFLKFIFTSAPMKPFEGLNVNFSMLDSTETITHCLYLAMTGSGKYKYSSLIVDSLKLVLHMVVVFYIRSALYIETG